MSDDLKYIDELVSSKLAGHAVESSGNTWAAVSRIAFWRNFLIFSFGRFNIYYAAMLLLIGISGLFYLLMPKLNAEQTNLQSNNYYKTNKLSESAEIVTANNNEINNMAFRLKPNGNIIYSVLKENTDNFNTNQHNQSNKQLSVLSDNLIKTEDKVIELNKKGFTKSKHKPNKVNTKKTKLKTASNNLTKRKAAKKENAVSSTKREMLAEVFSTKFNNKQSRDNFYNIEQLLKISLIDFTGFKIIEQSNLAELELQVKDSFDYFLPLEERSHWMLEYYLSPIYSCNITSSANTEMKSFIAEKQNIENPVISFTSGLNIIYKSNSNFIFQTGIAYSQLGEHISRKDIQEIDNYSYPLYPDGGFYDIDTIQFYNIDSLLQGIEYIETIYDSTWMVDNTIIDESDTTIYKGVNNRNKYAYIDIPVIVGYSVPYRQLDLQFKAGIITSFMLNAKGNKLNPVNDKEFISLSSDSPEYRKLNYSFVSGFDINYHMTERFDLVAGFLYRKNLYNIYQTYHYSQKYYATELHLGLKFHL